MANDASAFTRVDDFTVTCIRTLARKAVGTGTRVMSRDGKTLTFTGAGTTPNGREYNNFSSMRSSLVEDDNYRGSYPPALSDAEQVL